MKESKKMTYKANDNIYELLEYGELNKIQKDVEEACIKLLKALKIDYENDHNTIDTPKRMAKMYIQEIFKGRYTEKPKITTFPNVKKLDELYSVGPISIRSMCSHHFVPVVGKVWIGVIPNDTLIGLSKFNHIVDWFGSRPQIQEETVVQIADELEDIIQPKALGVMMKASHLCMSLRGVKDDDCQMTTSVVRGLFQTDSDARQEFLSMVK